MTSQKTLSKIRSSGDAVLLKNLPPPQFIETNIDFLISLETTELNSSKTTILREQASSA